MQTMKTLAALFTLCAFVPAQALAAAPSLVVGAEAEAVQDGMPDGDEDMPEGDDDLDFTDDEPGEADLFVDDDILAPAGPDEKKPKPKPKRREDLVPDAPKEEPADADDGDSRRRMIVDEEEEEPAPEEVEQPRRRAVLEETTTLRLDPEEPGSSEFDSATMGLIAGGGAVAAVVLVGALVGAAVVTSDLVLGLWGIPGLTGGDTGSVTVSPR